MSNQHIVPNSNGGWDLKAANSQRATKHFDTQRSAIDAGRQTAQNQHSELLIHGKNGQIRDRSSFGNDPFPPKG